MLADAESGEGLRQGETQLQPVGGPSHAWMCAADVTPRGNPGLRLAMMVLPGPLFLRVVSMQAATPPHGVQGGRSCSPTNPTMAGSTGRSGV